MFSSLIFHSSLSAPSSDDHSTEKSSKFSLPRLHGSSSMRKASSTSNRPITPTGSPKDVKNFANESPAKDADEKSNRGTLRKRTTSAPHVTTVTTNGQGQGAPTNGASEKTVNGVSGPIKQGQNILEQIGEADHAGWMRKRGERYNTWKLRYFVLKGPHLYWLRSNSKTVGFSN